MPKIVDHSRRRTELADTILDIIATGGINAVTMRTVADRSGWSTGTLSHYIGSRHDLLLTALRRAATLGRRKYLAESTSTTDPVRALQEILEGVLPLDNRRLALTKIFLVFYGEAGADENVASEIRSYLRNWRNDVTTKLMEIKQQALIDSDTDCYAIASTLVALVDGYANQAVLDPDILEQLCYSSPVPTWLAKLLPVVDFYTATPSVEMGATR